MVIEESPAYNALTKPTEYTVTYNRTLMFNILNFDILFLFL